MIRILLYIAFFTCLHANGQRIQILKLDDNNFFKFSKKQMMNKSVTIDSVLHTLQNWDKYQTVDKVNQSYVFYFEDSTFGKVPMRLFIPETYNKNVKSPLILLLHGAVQVSSFDRASDLIKGTLDSSEADDDVFFNYLSKQGYIILRPFADTKKKFNWVFNSFENPILNDNVTVPNKTYKCLVNVILKLKQTLNIDDSKIFAFGHSDGGDGAFCMELFQPSIFSGFVVYNSMLTNLFDNIYLGNVQNRSIYIVHSDLDDIRPIEQTRKIVDFLKAQYNTILYKEYKGYKHFDKHLVIDLPFANKFILQSGRDPFPKNIYWESNNLQNNGCDWILVNGFDLNMSKADWQNDYNFDTYNKIDKTWRNYPYYSNKEGYAIKGNYNNNIFSIETSRVTDFEILISSKMVDISRPVKVFLNKKLVFDKIVKANKDFIINNFEKNFDRQALWETSIKLHL